MPDDDDLRDLEDPELLLVPVTTDQLKLAQEDIEGCEACDPEAEIPFDWVIRDHVTNQGYVDYILPAPAKRPKCKAAIHEKTLVMPVVNPDAHNWI